MARAGMWVSVLLLMASVGGLAGTAAAAVPSSFAQALGPAREALVQGAQTRVATLRTALASDSYEQRIRAALGAAAPATPGLLIPNRAQRRRVTTLDPALRAPVARLLTAVEQARAMMGSIPVADFDRDLAAVARATEGPGALGTLSAPSTHAATESARAALLLGAALDQALPELRAAVGRSGAGSTVEGCDMLDATPILCVGSAADNHYTQDALLSIDLGGDDVYDTAAGGTPVLVQGADAPVSLNIDLAGDDVYRAPSGRTPGQAVLGDSNVSLVRGQGASLIGVGLLVDQQGDDRYEAVAPVPSKSHPQSLAYAQGATDAGVGGLFDLAGSDTYSCTVPAFANPSDKNLDAQFSDDVCQAYAGSMLVTDGPPTAALLLDSGQGDEHYTMSTGEVRGRYALGYVIGQGFGSFGGNAVLSDDGGRDAFSMVSHAAFEAADPEPMSGKAESYGQGAGLINGMGALLEGDGPTDYVLGAAVSGGSWAQAWGQGHAGGGDGLLDDRSGDDHYLLSAVRDDTVSEDCPAGGCDDAYLNPYTEWVSGQGYNLQDPQSLAVAGTGNAGALLDHGGDDSYQVVADKRVTVTVHDTGPSTATPTTLETSIPSQVLGTQGFGLGGMLLDEAGTDDYSVSSDRSLSAEVRSTGGAPQGGSTAQAGCMTHSQSNLSMYSVGGGQGGAGGVLADTGASSGPQHISYTMRTHLDTAPNTDGGLNNECGYPAAGGAGSGVLWVPDGGSPTYVNISPTRPAVALGAGQGRGFGEWRDPLATIDAQPVWDLTTGLPVTSLPGTSLGWVEGAPQANQTSLRFTAGSASAVDAYAESIPAVLALSDGSGAPLPGRTVHVMLQWQCGNLCAYSGRTDPATDQSWNNLWSIDAVTDAHGVAHGAVPQNVIALYKPQAWRLVAVFDGNAAAKGALAPSWDVRALNG